MKKSTNRKKLSDPYRLRIPIELDSQFRELAKNTGRTITSTIRSFLVSPEEISKKEEYFNIGIPFQKDEERIRALRYLSKKSDCP